MGQPRTRRWWPAALAVPVVLGVAACSGPPAPDPRDAPRTPASPPASAPASASVDPRLPVPGDLLDRAQVRQLGGKRWTVDRTHANTSGDGINSICQQRRFADPRGSAATVRSFRAVGRPRRTAVQTVEVSRSASAAHRSYRTTVGWYADCRVARLQVLAAYRVERVGDEAQVLALRLSEGPVTTLWVAVARTGAVVTSTVGTTVGAAPPPVAAVVRTLEDAVRNLCVREVAGRCVVTPTYRAVPPPPAGPREEKGILSVADLPPVGRVDEPWVGTRPTRGGTVPSVTTCDRADFRAAGAVRTRTRTYLIPGSGLPVRFGLSESYGRFRSPKAASRFLSDMRAALAGCERRDLSTEVSAEQRRSRTSPQADLSQWLLTTTVSPDQKVRLRIGLVRVGTYVAQVTLSPTPGADMTSGDFGWLLARAGDRLRELPSAAVGSPR